MDSLTDSAMQLSTALALLNIAPVFFLDGQVWHVSDLEPSVCPTCVQYALVSVMELLLPERFVSYETREAVVFLVLVLNSLLFLVNMVVALVQVVFLVV